MPFRPLRDQILVKPIPWRQSSTIEVISHDRYSRAIVIACGPGEPIRDKHGRLKRLREMEVKAGDCIVYGFDQIFPVYRENEIEYRILQDKDVCFISAPDFIDAHSNLSDEEIANLISLHRFANRELSLHAA